MPMTEIRLNLIRQVLERLYEGCKYLYYHIIYIHAPIN